METVDLYPSDFSPKVVPLVYRGWESEAKALFSPARERFARERVFLNVSRAVDLYRAGDLFGGSPSILGRPSLRG